MAQPSDWRIRKQTQACATCERSFEEEETFFSQLCVEGADLVRRDECRECFSGKEGAQEPEEVAEARQESGRVVFWRTRRPPEGKRRLAVDFDVVEELFFALASRKPGEPGSQDERLCQLRYLLSLLLLRKKRLKLVRVVRTTPEGGAEGPGEAMVVRRPRRTDEHPVLVFDLTDEQASELRSELARIFEGDPADWGGDGGADGDPAPAEDDEDDGDEGADAAEADAAEVGG